MKMFHIILFALFISSPFTLMAEVVDINHDNARTLAEHLQGVGKTRARAIVTYRKEHGLFKNVDELLNVKGIGEKTLAANRKNIILGPKKK
jgi:competence protein ComEA